MLALGELLLVEPGLAGHAEARVWRRAEGEKGAAACLRIGIILSNFFLQKLSWTNQLADWHGYL